MKIYLAIKIRFITEIILRSSEKPSILRYFVVFFAMFFIVLNPYTIYGKPGVLVAGIICVYVFANGSLKFLVKEFSGFILVLMFISLIGVESSAIHGIFQLNHFISVFSLAVIIISSYGIYLFSQRSKISIDNILFILLLVILANSLIVILELSSDRFRELKEGFLDPLKESSINYAEGFRMRGLASAGGANLSLTIPAAIIIALYLFKEKILNPFFLIISILLLIFSATVIGRTGLLLIGVPFTTYFIFCVRLKNLTKFFSIFMCFLLAGYFIYDNLIIFLLDKFGESFLDYSFKFIFEGKKGFENEGTVGVVAQFLTVIPTSFPETFFGYGFYGGSDFYPWTDSGYSRMFLSVGYFFGFIFYILIFRLFLSIRNFDKFLVYSFIILLVISEAKEPLLFSGYVSRIFLIIIVFEKSVKINKKIIITR